MKTRKRQFIVVLMSLLFFVTGIFAVSGIQSTKAHALTPDYSHEEGIYYFYDSSPSFSESESQAIAGPNLKVTYDKKPLVSEQELAYLLYTGYFWGFPGSGNVTVVIDIKTIVPQLDLLEELFTCLKQQNCKVIYITAASAETYHIYVDKLSSCTDVIFRESEDDFAYFFEKSIIDMACINTGVSFDSYPVSWNGVWDNDWRERFGKTLAFSLTEDF